VARETKRQRADREYKEALAAQVRSWMSPQASVQQRYLASIALVKGSGGILRSLGVDTGLKINTGGFALMPLEWPEGRSGSVSMEILKQTAQAAASPLLGPAGPALLQVGEKAAAPVARKLNPIVGGGYTPPDFIQVDDLMVITLSLMAIAEAAGPALGAFAGALAEGGIETVEAVTPG